MERHSYQVLARKWRPQQFDDVVGQRSVVQTLANALGQARIAHAYCFSGIRGVGKTTIARLLAKGLNCRAFDSPTATPCGECESCREIMDGRSLDVFERDAASDRGINEMKELIEIARYAPSRDRYKVMILDEAHMLTAEASNALLKVLEEPPEYIVFVLATTETNKILPTILSRCQHYQFSRISQREIHEHLAKMATAESIQISADGLALVATAADGSLRDAQSLLDKLIAFAGDTIDENTVVDLLGLVDRVLLVRAIDLIAAEDVAGVLELVNEMVEQGVDLHQFTVDLIGHLRNLLIVKTVDEPGGILHLPEADLDTLVAQAGQFEVDDLDRGFTLVAGSEYRIKMAEQPRYHLEVVLARLARMPRLQPIADLLAALEGGSSGGSGSTGAGNSGKGRTTSGDGHAARSARERPAASASASPATPAAPATPAPDAAAAATAGAEAPRPTPPVAPAAPTAAAAVDPASPGMVTEPAVAEPAPSSGILGRVQAKLGETHPLVAQSLGRTSSVEVAGETLVFRFPPTAGLFAERFKDPEIIPALKAACEAALGRTVVPRVEIDERATATTPPPAPTAAPPAPAATAPTVEAPRGAHPGAGAPAPAPAPAAPNTTSPGTSTPAPRPASPDAKQQAEQEPLVQSLLTELKGTVLSVEEL